LHFSSTHRMPRRLTQEMRCKIAVWQELNKSERQTQRLYMEFGINTENARTNSI